MAGMIERVARALAHSAGCKMLAHGQSAATREFGWDACHDYTKRYVEAHWKEHVHAAEFAIQAMRDPTDEMLIAGTPYYHDNWRKDHVREDTSMELIWQAMIDVAQADKP